jgi:hypothetical protein
MKKKLFVIAIVLTVAMNAYSQVERDFVVGITADGEGVVIRQYLGNLAQVRIPSTIQGMPVREIGDEAFYYFETMTSRKPWTNIIIPEGVIRIGRRAFSLSDRLRNVVLPSTLEVIGELAFWGCENLTSLVIPNTIKSIGKDAFADCYNWPINIPRNILTESETLPEIFSRTNIKNLIIPEGIKIIRRDTFVGCRYLESITLPSTISEIHTAAFKDCQSLVTVTIPDSVTTIEFTNGDPRSSWRFTAKDCFQGCIKLSLISQAALKKRGYTGSF